MQDNYADKKQRVSLETLAERVRAIEEKFDEVASHMSIHMGTPIDGLWPAWPSLLVGHAEIARFIKKSPSAVRRYARKMGFPAWRFGRHVVSHPNLIASWLIAVEKKRRGLL